MTHTSTCPAVLFGNRGMTPGSNLITVLCRTTGGRWREVGTAANYFEALDVAERSGLRGVKWWFRTDHTADLVKELTPNL